MQGILNCGEQRAVTRIFNKVYITMDSQTKNSAKKMKRTVLIVCVGNTFEEIQQHEGDFTDWISHGLGQQVEIVTIDARQTEMPLPAACHFDGVVITGSHAMVTDRMPWIDHLAAWIRDCIATEIPLLGICFGHQLIAYAMGGHVGYNPRGLEIGTKDVRITDAAMEDVLFKDLPKAFSVQLVHAQSALTLPKEATLLAGNTHEPHQAFRIGRNAWGVQFHPEFSAATMRSYIEIMAAKKALPAIKVDQLLHQVKNTFDARMLLTKFAEIVMNGAYLYR
jgi:GMP synthase (glutamine-hydrolysing)